MYESIIQGVENWLLASNVQIDTGADKGAIAGWLNHEHKPEFAYMELTGYYLTCMAFVISKSIDLRSKAIARGQKAVDWLHRCVIEREEIPPTRKYVDCRNQEDWRNAAVFSFDIAMVLRGLSAILPLLDDGRSFDLICALVDRLVPFCDVDCCLKPYILRHGSADTYLLQKWSTMPGPYQMKIALAISSLFGGALTQKLTRVQERIRSDWSDYYDNGGRVADLHPAFYYLEGMLVLGMHDCNTEYHSVATRLYSRIMEHQTEEGCLPATVGSGTPIVRSDVVAQALRIGTILKDLGYIAGPEWDRKLRKLAESLAKFVTSEGLTSFYPIGDGSPKHWNAWCAMVTYQALSFYQMIERNENIGELVHLLI